MNDIIALILEIDYSHGIIFIEDIHTGEEYQATWTGIVDMHAGMVCSFAHNNKSYTYTLITLEEVAA